MSRSILSSLVLVASLGAPLGCDGISEKAEAEKKIAAEQGVIEAYSAKVPEVDARLKAFIAAWEKANEKTDLKSLKDDLEANVRPAFAAHIAALEGMPLGSDRLRAIHAPLVTTYKAAQAAMDTFAREVTEETLDREYAKLLAAMDAVKKAEETYAKELAAYYEAHRVSLKKGP